MSISVSEVISEALSLTTSDEQELPFYQAALELGASPDAAEILDELACEAVMRGRGAL